MKIVLLGVHCKYFCGSPNCDKLHPLSWLPHPLLVTCSPTYLWYPDMFVKPPPPPSVCEWPPSTITWLIHLHPLACDSPTPCSWDMNPTTWSPPPPLTWFWLTNPLLVTQALPPVCDCHPPTCLWLGDCFGLCSLSSIFLHIINDRRHVALVSSAGVDLLHGHQQLQGLLIPAVLVTVQDLQHTRKCLTVQHIQQYTVPALTYSISNNTD